MLKQVDAHRLRRDLILADRLKGASIGGVDQQHHQCDADSSDDKRGKQNRQTKQFREGWHLIKAIGAVCNGIHLRAGKNGADDLGKSKRGNRQIIAFQTQHRDTDQCGKSRSDQAAGNQRQKWICRLEPRRASLHRLFHRPNSRRDPIHIVNAVQACDRDHQNRRDIRSD